MSRKIKFFDTTLRDGEQTPGVSLSLNEKLQIAKQLEVLKVDIIEAGFAISSPGDFEAVRGVAAEMGSGVTVASLSRTKEADIDAAWDAVKYAKNPRIHTFLATSDIHMKYKLKMTPEQVLENSVHAVKYAKKYTSDVQFSAEDAGRTDPAFLAKVVKAVIDAGATTVNIPDTVGYNTPWEFGGLIQYLFKTVDNIDRADIACHCHNDLGLAVVNSIAAAREGVTQIEGCINGLGERGGNASLEEVIMSFATRKDYYDFAINIDTTQIYRTSRLVSSLTGVDVQPNKAIVGANAFAHESGIHQHGMLANAATYEIMTPESVGVPVSKMVLGKLSGKHAFSEKLKEMGFQDVSEEKLEKAFRRFKEIADRKKVVLDADIESIMIGDNDNVVPAYELDSFQSLGGNHMMATATVRLRCGDEFKVEAATGNGPVEAAYNAINRIVGAEFTLEGYNIKAVTEGSDALGEVTVKISREGNMYIGRSVATDIIESSIRAYVNALNKS